MIPGLGSPDIPRDGALSGPCGSAPAPVQHSSAFSPYLCLWGPQVLRQDFDKNYSCCFVVGEALLPVCCED